MTKSYHPDFGYKDQLINHIRGESAGETKKKGDGWKVVASYLNRYPKYQGVIETIKKLSTERQEETQKFFAELKLEAQKSKRKQDYSHLISKFIVDHHYLSQVTADAFQLKSKEEKRIDSLKKELQKIKA